MSRRMVAIGAVVFLAAACGQYPGVHQRGVATGEVGGSLAGTQGPAGTGTTATGVGGAAGTGTSASGATGSTSSATGGDTTGITDKLIKIGLHAPLTGAAPISPKSFRDGKDLYWNRGTGHCVVKVYGRCVQVTFEDDQYNPSHARQVCQKMAEQDRVFAEFGGGGTDQIVSCAQYAQANGIPYMSAGVTEINLSQYPTYFALSMSYPAQVPLLAQYIRKHWTKKGTEIAMIATNTAYFDDAVNAFKQQFPGVTVFRPSKNDHGTDMATNVCSATGPRYKVVFPLVAPVFYLEMAKSAKCNPQYAGLGITMGLDTVANTGCNGGAAAGTTEGARFFSPAPAFANSDRYDTAFRKAGGSDDIMFLLWGLNKTIHQLLLRAGPNLSRESFIASTQQASVRTGVYPDLRFSASDHFGANTVNLLRNVCQGNGGHYVTEAAFRSSF